MKKFLFIPLLLLAAIGVAQTSKQKKKVIELPDSTTTPIGKYKDNIDDRIKGPNGEKVYIGPNGGRYYMKENNKIYIQSKANKKKAM